MFRELLQNSDDAQSQAVEIRFETRGYLDSDKASGESLTLNAPTSTEPLPDLKAAVVRSALVESARWTQGSFHIGSAMGFQE